MHPSLVRIGEQPPLTILYEDKDLIAVAKPAGLLFHGYTKGLPLALVDQVKLSIKERYGKTGEVYCAVTHRLDRPVSGVSLFAKNSKAASRLGAQFSERKVLKVYLAASAGAFTEAEGMLEDWLQPLASSDQKQGTDPQFCTLSYQRKALTGDGAQLLAIQLGTGRRHQIRQQLALRGSPIFGDQEYGGKTFVPDLEDPRFRPMALHAAYLEFEHPLKFEPLRVVAPLPDYWSHLPEPLFIEAQAFLIAAQAGRKDFYVS